MKKFKYLLCACFFLSSIAFSEQKFTNFTGALEEICDTLYDFLPENATLLSTQPDAFIGRFFPSIPCRFSVGLATSATLIDTEFVADNFQVIIDDISSALPKDYFKDIGFSIPQKIPLPTAAVTARIGGIILPFDIGAFAVTTTDSLIKDVSFDDFSMDFSYTCAGADLRYALIEGGNILPKLSVGAGYIYSKFDFGIELDKTLYSTEYDIGKLNSSININLECHTFYGQAQISKKLLIFVPFAGVKALVTAYKTDYGWSVSTTNLIKDLYFGESKSEEIRGPFQTQFYTGCGIQLPFIQFGINAAYNFQSHKYSGAFIANLKI